MRVIFYVGCLLACGSVVQGVQLKTENPAPQTVPIINFIDTSQRAIHQGGGGGGAKPKPRRPEHMTAAIKQAAIDAVKKQVQLAMNQQIGQQVKAHNEHKKCHQEQHKQIKAHQEENLKLHGALNGMCNHHLVSSTMPYMLGIPHVHDINTALKGIMG